jgi:hypothetical protein
MRNFHVSILQKLYQDEIMAPRFIKAILYFEYLPFMRYVRCLDTGVECLGYGEVMLKVQVIPRER